jgi:hypothetical protein
MSPNNSPRTANAIYDIDTLSLAAPYCDIVLNVAHLGETMYSVLLRSLVDVPIALNNCNLAEKRSSPEKKSLAKNRVPPRPVLVIGWGQEGVRDVNTARDEFPCDEGMDCVDARGADSADVGDSGEGNRDSGLIVISIPG